MWKWPTTTKIQRFFLWNEKTNAPELLVSFWVFWGTGFSPGFFHHKIHLCFFQSCVRLPMQLGVLKWFGVFFPPRVAGWYNKTSCDLHGFYDDFYGLMHQFLSGHLNQPSKKSPRIQRKSKKRTKRWTKTKTNLTTQPPPKTHKLPKGWPQKHLQGAISKIFKKRLPHLYTLEISSVFDLFLLLVLTWLGLVLGRGWIKIVFFKWLWVSFGQGGWGFGLNFVWGLLFESGK